MTQVSIRPVVAVASKFSPRLLSKLSGKFDLVDLRSDPASSDLAACQALIVGGGVPTKRDMLAKLPNARLIVTFGAGHDHIDRAYAAAQGMQLASGAGANSPCVADHCVAVVLSLLRGLTSADRFVRNGEWRDLLTRPLARGIEGLRCGILGLGSIGLHVANRLAPFGLEIAYHSRKKRRDVSLPYLPTVHELAAFSDVLVVATPGGPGTHHIVDASVIAALGPSGYLVNVARGSVVDQQALISSLEAREIAGAGLDVFETEPQVDARLLKLENVILSPHLAGFTEMSIQRQENMLEANLDAFFSGRPLVSPVPYVS